MRARLLRPRRRHDLEPRAPAAASRKHFTHHDARHPRPRRDGRRSSHELPTRARHPLPPRSRRTTWPRDRPFDDFDVNAVGTLNLLEAARRHAARSRRVHLHEHEQGLRRRAQRAAAGRAARRAGTTPTRRLRRHRRDAAASTAACTASSAPPRWRPTCMVQEYGRYFGMKTGMLPRRLPDRPEPLRRRAARLPHLPRASASREGRPYPIFGYKGKQVRDNIHSLRRLRGVRGVLREPARRRGLQPRRRPRQQRARSSRRSRRSRS